MIVLDTSIWIEFLKRNPAYFSAVRSLLENQQIYGLEFVFGELLQGCRDIKENNIIIEYWENIPHIINDGIWLEAGLLSSGNRLLSKGIGLIDCAIIISARKAGAQLWTLDKKLDSALKKEERFVL
jgi:predicted nucleic acid-binding protein